MSDLLGPKRRSASIADLLAASTAGEQWATEDLAAEYLPRLTAFAASRGAADPEGIADVALLSVLKRLDQLDFEVPAQLWAYLCMTARSRIIDEHRAAKPVELVADPGALDRAGWAVTQAPDAIENETADRDYVDGLLAPLTDEQRQVLELRFLDDLSIETTAERTGRTEGAVKGLQRRAINAILAAVAVVAVVLMVRAFDGRSSLEIDQGPADRSDEVDDRQSLPDAATQATDGDDAADTTGPLAVELGETDEPGAGDAGEGDQELASTAWLGPDRFDVTDGTDRSAALDISGPPGPASTHGVRVRCAVSHIALGDPTDPGAEYLSALTHWGNTVIAGPGVPDDLATIGRGTCDGGVTDRSAYWVPTLFDEADQAVLPESILVEYKAFGNETWDRGLLQPIPVGLQMTAEPTVLESRPPAGDPVKLSVAFPSCVQVDVDGLPVLSSVDRVSHLAYPSGGEGCPATHPYRIPQLTFLVRYDVAFGSGWYLAPAEDGGSRSQTPTGGAVSAWDPAAMEDLVTCVRELLEGCWFQSLPADGDATGSDPNGPDADRTPFGTSIPAVVPAGD
ncbi:MAG: sigma-70 family RNA polymerase sigma factor [Actinomycetota bacterium]